ncbi:MAG: hypothetical protein HY848_12165 [Betaproteobacteria bacterium]|nr:hypothetical protein [Betaproteobacteria bacterium]
MMEFISTNSALLGVIITVCGGVFAFIKWNDQRRRELQERRFEQYWKLLNVSQEKKVLAKHKVALLLLKKYPEYGSETIEFLEDAKKVNHPWTEQNRGQVDSVIRFLERQT